MEVTRNNFEVALDKITTVLKDADFVSFDLELTGLGCSLGERIHDLDTPEERYKKIRKGVKEYGITQIGVSIFRYCESKNKFSNATFCFFLSGNPKGSYRYDTASMNFLARNGFDFKKMFLDGLTFISLTEEVKIRQKRTATLQEMGFYHVVKAILEANKPMVGHNMTLDLLHFVDKFVAPLPLQLEELKTIFKANLPTIYDTKIFAKDPPFSSNIPNSSLESLYDDLTGNYSPPKFGCEEGYKSYELIKTEGQVHDGGFDAFMTGVCFITMLKMLEGERWGRSAMMKSKHLEKYSNKTNFMRSYDMSYIDMYKPIVIPDRSHIFTVSCPSSWKMSNVRRGFSSLKSYKIVWVSDTRLFVIPQDEEAAKARLLLSRIRAACSPNVRVDFYEQEDAAAKRNEQVNSAVTTRHRGADMTRPSSITLKRSSDSKDTVGADEGAPMDADCVDSVDSGRNLKRLKSVGSELLSNMTLESPMNVEKELPDTARTLGQEKGKEAKVAEASDASQVISVPEVW